MISPERSDAYASPVYPNLLPRALGRDDKLLRLHRLQGIVSLRFCERRSIRIQRVMSHRIPLNPKLWIRACEDFWFDRTRRVHTSGLLPKPDASRVLGAMRDSNIYGPVRARSARNAIRALPVRDLSKYTFVDIGSGKGRALFLAAEFPFRRVLGVEYAPHLHVQALENIRSFRHSSQRSGPIESMAANAAEFDFPDGDLVVFLFNPFGPEVTRLMLANLQRSLERNPRHVLMLMMWPEHGDVVAQTPGVRTVTRNARYHVYEVEPLPAVMPLTS